jgi:hypothetical protein
MSDAPLGIIARFGHIDTGRPIPAARGAIRLAGFELQPWHAFLPRGLSQAIGGDIMDINVDTAISADVLDCTVAIVTPAGDALKLKVGGTPRRPHVEQDGIQGIVADRAKQAGFNAMENVADTGKGMGGAAVSSVTTAGKGAGKTVWGIATGLFETAASASTGDVVGTGTGLWDTASGGVSNTAGTIGNTAGSVASGIVRSGSAAFGGDRNELWRADTQRRWARSWEEARRSMEDSGAAEHRAGRLTGNEHSTDLP